MRIRIGGAPSPQPSPRRGEGAERPGMSMRANSERAGMALREHRRGTRTGRRSAAASRSSPRSASGARWLRKPSADRRPPNAILVMFATGKRTRSSKLARGRIAPRFPAGVQADPHAAFAVDRRPVGMAVLGIDADERPRARRACRRRRCPRARSCPSACRRLEQPPVRRDGGPVGDRDSVDRRARQPPSAKQ